MADDWKPGDLALCVTSGTVHCPNCLREFNGLSAPPRGAVREVLRVGYCSDDVPPHEWQCYEPVLYFQDGRGGLGIRFRKIRPHTPDAEDLRTIALLNGKPVKEPVNG